MLDFWYSEKCHRQIKLTVCIVLCLIIYYTAQIVELHLVFVGLSLILGICIHVLRQFKIKLIREQRYPKSIDAIFFILPILYWLILMITLPKQHLWALILQAIGFIALGLLVISIYSNRRRAIDYKAKR